MKNLTFPFSTGNTFTEGKTEIFFFFLELHTIINYFNAGGSTNFYETQIGSFLTNNGWFWVKKSSLKRGHSFAGGSPNF